MPEMQTTDTSINRKVKSSMAGGGIGLGGGVAICEMVKATINLSDTIESYVCLFILLVFVVSGVLGFGYFTSPAKNDGVVPVTKDTE